jgi:hypothetical protein
MRGTEDGASLRRPEIPTPGSARDWRAAIGDSPIALLRAQRRARRTLRRVAEMGTRVTCAPGTGASHLLSWFTRTRVS